MHSLNKTYTALPYTLSDFDFELPADLIAQFPAKERSASRLLQVNGENDFCDGVFADIVREFNAGDVLVLNNTKVVPARLQGKKISGGQLEIFVERIQDNNTALCMIRANRAPKPGVEIDIAGHRAMVSGRQGVFFIIELINDDSDWETLMQASGDIPLPPYIQRAPIAEDSQRYQTVYAEKAGAVAAPTAGLHFDNALLAKLADKGVEITYITLHVGAGTFQPVKNEWLDTHQMHFELFEIPDETRRIVNAAKTDGRRVTAVGTTSLRALESAAQDQRIVMAGGDTDLFIRPGYPFEIVDRLITNFHLPKSSLMMLVSALAGYETIRSAYQHAINQRYRFFSYGDAMLLKTIHFRNPL
ncbi:tRNA preQ1(34) S-adenosylmethionine ribosyltransferase-isomerase QueA [Ostreibacterium oceani]|uniref:S-adenosylmethionine:tRNA ribosyltransferase-isomerase n=1 Tax=Ostreibacterium oceani TaxID=2654998 RepID=A0A6N7ESS7_9GAMM|nr:tRNA preQ1(34) S-adenosylmethionine ribosyltransferase-isomerase QueA [Ostreibacterium oceani]MPV85601.1 tRNA preQ1(34) S-adenosylmethionine ribosyltransferase-isomerase QueA [Ostreibacterium oceani]